MRGTMRPDPDCLRFETIMAEFREAKRWSLLGKRSFALYHAKQVLSIASKAKSPRSRMAAFRLINLIRRKA